VYCDGRTLSRDGSSVGSACDGSTNSSSSSSWEAKGDTGGSVGRSGFVGDARGTVDEGCGRGGADGRGANGRGANGRGAEGRGAGLGGGPSLVSLCCVYGPDFVTLALDDAFAGFAGAHPTDSS
jgi:hypothetical protein